MAVRSDTRQPALALLAFGLLTLTILACQIVLSRLLAGTMTYYYAFMLVSLAMLGLAAGGLLVQLFPRRFPYERRWEQAAAFSLATGVSLFAGTLLALALLPRVKFGGLLGVFTSDYLGLAGVFWCLFPTLFFGGLAVSLVLAHSRDHFHLFYGVDLMSAAAGCLIAVPLLIANTPVEALLRVVAVLPVVAAALFALAAKAHRRSLLLVAGAAILAIGGALLAKRPEISRPPHLSWLGRPTFLSEWNAISAVRVHPVRFFTTTLSGTYAGPPFRMLDLLIDGLGGTQIVEFDGKADSLARYAYLEHDLLTLGHLLTPADGNQLIIGPGGGVDILQGVRQGRKDITIVEINPLIVRVVNEDLAAFSGRPYHLPGVRLHVENGRTFLRRSDARWDLISLSWVDTGGSATALAFSENYLYTVEAYEDYLRHLTPGGHLVVLRSLGIGELRIDSLRGLAVVVTALGNLGSANPGDHLVVAASYSPHFHRPMCLVLAKRSPYSAEELAITRAYLQRMGFFTIWLPGGERDMTGAPGAFAPYANLMSAIIGSTPAQREEIYRQAPLDVRPSTDDNPFYFVERGGPRRATGAGVAQLKAFLAILASLVLPFLVLPALKLLRGTRRIGLGGAFALGYFSLLGLAFLLVEIEFFHVFALILGSPTWTLAIVLAGLLVSSGCGSLQARRIAELGGGALLAVFLVLGSLLAAFVGFKHGILTALIVLPFPARALATVALIFPIGFLMGVPLPAGMRLIRGREDLILWGWVLNGAFSVFASVLAVFLAIHIGTSRTVVVGIACYLAAGVLLQWFRRAAAATAP